MEPAASRRVGSICMPVKSVKSLYGAWARAWDAKVVMSFADVEAGLMPFTG